MEDDGESLVVHVTLKGAVTSDRYQLIVLTEQHVGDATEFVLPRFTCLNVLRQQGRFGVIKVTWSFHACLHVRRRM